MYGYKSLTRQKPQGSTDLAPGRHPHTALSRILRAILSDDVAALEEALQGAQGASVNDRMFLAVGSGRYVVPLRRGSATCLHVAAAAGSASVARWLLERQADASLRDGHSNSPRALARSPKVLAVLQRHQRLSAAAAASAASSSVSAASQSGDTAVSQTNGFNGAATSTTTSTVTAAASAAASSPSSTAAAPSWQSRASMSSVTSKGSSSPGQREMSLRKRRLLLQQRQQELAALEERARQLRDRKRAAKEALSDGDGFDIGIVDDDDMDDGVEDNDVDDIGTGDGGKPAAAAAAAAIARRGSRRSMAVSSSTTLTPGSSPSQVMEALQAGATPMPQSVQELATETEAMTKEIVEMEAALATRRAKLEEAKAVATARLEKRRSELASTASLVDAIHKKRMQELADAARAVQGRDQQVRELEAQALRAKHMPRPAWDASVPFEARRYSSIHHHIEALLEELKVQDSHVATLRQHLSTIALQEQLRAMT